MFQLLLVVSVSPPLVRFLADYMLSGLVRPVVGRFFWSLRIRRSVLFFTGYVGNLLVFCCLMVMWLLRYYVGWFIR